MSSMAKKKYEFRPDKTGPSLLDKLHLTRAQRRNLVKWLLYALVLLALSVLQDVILCKFRIFGATTDLVPCGILLICLAEGVERGCVFALVASLLFLFSGSAPGFYAVPVLTALAVGVTILRQGLLQKGFASTMLCVALGMLLYEAVIYVAGLVLELTRPDRLIGFAATAVLSFVTAPVLHPIIRAIGRIGGESWKD